MKRINNSDVNILLHPKYINIDNFNITFYTVNADTFYVRKNQNDVITVEREATVDDVEVILTGGTTVTEYYIKLDWNELVTLGKGILQYMVINNIVDEDRADNYYNKIYLRTTEFYISSNVTVDEETAKSINEIIGELGIKIDSEITRSTSADTEHVTALNNEIETRQTQITELLNLYNNVIGLTSNNVNRVHFEYNEDTGNVSWDMGTF